MTTFYNPVQENPGGPVLNAIERSHPSPLPLVSVIPVNHFSGKILLFWRSVQVRLGPWITSVITGVTFPTGRMLFQSHNQNQYTECLKADMMLISTQNTHCLIIEHEFFEGHEVGECEENFKHFTIQLFASWATSSHQHRITTTCTLCNIKTTTIIIIG